MQMPMPRASSLRAAVLVASRRLQAGSKFRLSRCAAAGATSRVCPPAGQYAAITGRCVLACAHLRLAVVIVDLLQVRNDRLRILHVGDVDLVNLLAGHRQSLKGVGQVVARLGQGLLGRLLRGEWAGAARSDRRARRDMQATARQVLREQGAVGAAKGCAPRACRAGRWPCCARDAWKCRQAPRGRGSQRRDRRWEAWRARSGR